MTAKSELPADWIDAVIRKVLQSPVGDAGPSPAAWTRICRRIEALASSPSPHEDNPCGSPISGSSAAREQ